MAAERDPWDGEGAGFVVAAAAVTNWLELKICRGNSSFPKCQGQVFPLKFNAIRGDCQDVD